ncbi:response regulator [Azohydromonas australica]|uniref:response regulator n=1 Tax=Azohydromonas australica TaxID=364039 RepID=UPI002873C6B6|nr:response regulator [Azohydromonas australica]
MKATKPSTRRRVQTGAVTPGLHMDQPSRRQEWSGASPAEILARHRPGRADPLKVLEVLITLFNAGHTVLEKTVSHKTRHDRAAFLRRFFPDLQAKAGFRKLPDPRNLGYRHVHAMVRVWQQERLAPPTVQTYLSFLRGLALWTGKPGLVHGPEHYGLVPAQYQRHEAAERDRSWSGHGIEVDALIERITAHDRYVGTQLAVMHALGLRRKEAVMLRPRACTASFPKKAKASGTSMVPANSISTPPSTLRTGNKLCMRDRLGSQTRAARMRHRNGFVLLPPSCGIFNRSRILGRYIKAAEKTLAVLEATYDAIRWQLPLEEILTFAVWLPLTAAPGKAGNLQPSGTPPAAPARRRVLVVDNNVDGAESLVMMLQLLGHEAQAVHGGQAALAQAGSWRPDVVLLDIGLPDLNGYGVARQAAHRACIAGADAGGADRLGQRRRSAPQRASRVRPPPHQAGELAGHRAGPTA